MLSQLSRTIKVALKSTERERQLLRPRSAVQRFPVVEWRTLPRSFKTQCSPLQEGNAFRLPKIALKHIISTLVETPSYPTLPSPSPLYKAETSTSILIDPVRQPPTLVGRSMSTGTTVRVITSPSIIRTIQLSHSTSRFYQLSPPLATGLGSAVLL